MSDYNTAWNALVQAVGGDMTELDHLSTDQKLKAAEVAALLSISQELSQIQQQGINPDFDSD